MSKVLSNHNSSYIGFFIKFSYTNTIFSIVASFGGHSKCWTTRWNVPLLNLHCGEMIYMKSESISNKSFKMEREMTTRKNRKRNDVRSITISGVNLLWFSRKFRYQKTNHTEREREKHTQYKCRVCKRKYKQKILFDLLLN